MLTQRYVAIFGIPSISVALNRIIQVPVVSTSVGTGHAINKLQWDRKDGRRAALGGADGHLYIYDIGDMALPRETEWTDMQKTVSSIVGSGQANGVGDADASRLMAGR